MNNKWIKEPQATSMTWCDKELAFKSLRNPNARSTVPTSLDSAWSFHVSVIPLFSWRETPGLILTSYFAQVSLVLDAGSHIIKQEGYLQTSSPSALERSVNSLKIFHKGV